MLITWLPSNYTMNNQRIYIAHTTATDFPNTSKPDPATMTEVYNGTITWNGSGWHEITLSTSFSYNNSDNLVIYYENRDGSWASGYPTFRNTSTSSNYRAKYKFQDGSFPAVSGSRIYNRVYRPKKT